MLSKIITAVKVFFCFFSFVNNGGIVYNTPSDISMFFWSFYAAMWEYWTGDELQGHLLGRMTPKISPPKIGLFNPLCPTLSSFTYVYLYSVTNFAASSKKDLAYLSLPHKNCSFQRTTIVGKAYTAMMCCLVYEYAHSQRGFGNMESPREYGIHSLRSGISPDCS